MVRLLFIGITLALCSCGANEFVDRSTDISLLYAEEGNAPYQKYRYLFVPEQATDLQLDSVRMVNGIKSMRVYEASGFKTDSSDANALFLHQEHFFSEYGQTIEVREYEYEEADAAPSSTAITKYKYDQCGKLLEQLIFLDDTVNPEVEYYFHHYYVGTAANGSTINFKSEGSKLKGGRFKYVIENGAMLRLEATEQHLGSISMNAEIAGAEQMPIADVDWSVAFDYTDSVTSQRANAVDSRMLEGYANNQIFEYCPTGILLKHIPGAKVQTKDGVIVAHQVMTENGGRVKASINYEYDAAGRIIKQTFTGESSPMRALHPSAAFAFDKQGLLSQVTAQSFFDTTFIQLEYAFY